MNFFRELRNRNALLYWFGWYNLIAGIICAVMIFADDQQVLGINKWIKPTKFFLSVGVMVWTMGWLLFYLDAKKQVKIISWLIVISMFIENAIIAMQSFRNQQSHFNNSTALDGALFGIMGLFIIVFTVAAVWALVLFFRQKTFNLPEDYLWGVRLGLLLFIIFSLEGGIMVGRLSHTVGGDDGGEGLPFVNWSTSHGDLRIAHFLGLHALQILPLSAYLFFRTKSQVILFASVYFVVISLVLLQALRGMPLVG